MQTWRVRRTMDWLSQNINSPDLKLDTLAQALDISHNTVKLHVRHIMDKLNLRSRVEAAVFAFEYRSSPDGVKAASDAAQKNKG